MHDCSLITVRATTIMNTITHQMTFFFLHKLKLAGCMKNLSINISELISRHSLVGVFFSFWRSGSVMVDEKGTHSKHPPPLGTTFNVYYTCYNIVTGNVVIKNIPKVWEHWPAAKLLVMAVFDDAPALSQPSSARIVCLHLHLCTVKLYEKVDRSTG